MNQGKIFAGLAIAAAAAALFTVGLVGGAEGKTLYLAAQDRLYRMRLNIPGMRPQ